MTQTDAPRDPAARRLFEYRRRIESARVYEVAHISPLERAPKLSERLGNQPLLKREDLQAVHSFKLRGAYNCMANLTEAQRSKGVVTASAGNHAQGVALGAQRLGIKAWIVMPRTTPNIKVESVRALGGKAVLHGDSYDEASVHAQQLAQDKGLTYVPPYDHPDVIAGQGTVAREILDQWPEPIDAIFVPVGGGGLAAGVAAYVKSVRPSIKVIGVEPREAACLDAALKAQRRVTLKEVGLFADGVAVAQIGKEPWTLLREHIDEMVLVDVDEICAAIQDIFYENRSMAEPAGALAVAGAKRWAADNGVSGKTLAAVISGANVNFERLRHIAERAQIGEAHEALLAVTIPEQPGSFRRFCKELGKHGVTEFNYRYADGGAAHIFVGIKLSDGAGERHDIVENLRSKGYAVADLSEDEIAKVHVRYMVGGRAPGLSDERLFRFEFPERPGALLKFLNHIGQRWNISLFHYRNHGAAYGRVLVGLQVPRTERKDCRAALDALGYAYCEESDNPAYSLFLGTDAAG